MGQPMLAAGRGSVVAEDRPIMGLGSFGKRAFFGQKQTFDAWELTFQEHSM